MGRDEQKKAKMIAAQSKTWGQDPDAVLRSWEDQDVIITVDGHEDRCKLIGVGIYQIVVVDYGGPYVINKSAISVIRKVSDYTYRRPSRPASYDQWLPPQSPRACRHDANGRRPNPGSRWA